MAPLTLYHYWRSTSSWRVRWVLDFKKIPVQMLAMSLLTDECMSPEYLKKSPMGTVPVLEITTSEKTHFLSESTAIAEWAEELHPKPALFPENSFERARMRMLCELINSGVQPLVNLTVTEHLTQGLSEGEVSKASKKWSSHWIRRGFRAYETLIAQSAGDFVMGSKLTLADIYLIPQCYSALRNGVELDEFPTIARLNSRILETASCKASHPDCYRPT